MVPKTPEGPQTLGLLVVIYPGRRVSLHVQVIHGRGGGLVAIENERLTTGICG